MRSRPFLAICAFSVFVIVAAVASVAQRGPAPPTWPGSQGKGVTLLPNGWKIQPAGRHLSVGDLPLGMIESPDGNYLVITNNGYAKPTLTVVDLAKGYVSSKANLEHAWLGLAWHPDGRRVFSSGAGQTTVNEFYWTPGRLATGAMYALGRDTQKPLPGINRPEPVEQSFVGGIAISADGRYIYAVHVLGEALTMLDVKSGLVRATVDVGAEPYTCVVSPDGKTVVVSVWGGAKVLMFDAATLEQRGEVAVGEHPNAMIWSKDAGRLFVACANTNAVWVVDIAAMTAKEQISVALFPNSPPGSTPNGLGISPDGARLLVASADNNTVAVVDIREPGRSAVEGFIPTGWYPTAAQFSKDGSNIYVLSGQGADVVGQPARQPGGGARLRRRPVLGRHAAGFAVDRAGARRSHAAGDDEDRLQPDAADERGRAHAAVGGRRVPHPEEGRETPRPSSTSSTSSARTAPTIRSWATSNGGTATRTCACSARRSRRTRMPSRGSSSCSTTSTSMPRSATTATRTRRVPTPPTSSRRSGRPTTGAAAGAT